MGDVVQDFLSKLTAKQIGQYLKEYSDLYVTPFQAWRKAFNGGSKSYDYVVLNIIYYFFFTFLVFQEFYLSLKVVLAELIITILPLLFFYIPFVIFNKILKLKKSWKDLFRLLLIVKFQIAPLLVLILLSAIWSQSDQLFVFFENLMLIPFLLFMLAPPFAILMSNLKRLIWIILNYIFLITGLGLIGCLFWYFFSEDRFSDKVIMYTPTQEYLNIEAKASHNYRFISDSIYVAVLEIANDSTYKFHSSQLATSDLIVNIIKNSRNVLVKEMKYNDSILSVIKKGHVKLSDKHKIDSNLVVINMHALDSFKTESKIIKQDIDLYEHWKDSAKYESNRNYFQLVYSYLRFHDSLCTSFDAAMKICKSQTISDHLVIDSNKIVILYKLNPEFAFAKKKELDNEEKKLEQNLSNSEFLFRILFYPLYLFSDNFFIE